jgi:SAM-dependent methyltransferase
MSTPPDFSSVAGGYAVSRPTYPPELFAWLAGTAARRDVAWDAATGSGQAAVGLAAHFERVIATDSSEAQLRHAIPHERVIYRVARSEESGIESGSVDLVAAATALHWFDLPSFYDEVRRVARPGAVLAAWTYHVAHATAPLDTILWPFYRDVVQQYFAAGARLVDDRYEAIALPGAPLNPPAFVMTATWNASQILSFVRTWSGVQARLESTGEDPVAAIEPAVERACGGAGARVAIRWPIYLRAARL